MSTGKSRYTGWVVVLVVACLLFATTGLAADKVVTIKFANWGSLEKATEGVFKKMVADFEAANKNIKVELVNLPYGDIKQQVLVMMASGDVLDVVQAERAMVDTYIGSGYLSELDKVFDKKYLGDFYPNLLNDLRSDGKLYGVPWIVCPWVLVYNKDLFGKAGLNPNQPPKTYNEILADAAKLSALKDKDGNPVYGMGETTGLVPVSGGSVLRVMLSFGGGVWDKKGNVNVNTKGNISAFNYLKTLHQKQYNPEGAKLKDLRNLMAIGRLAMYFDQTWGTGGVFGINPDIKPQIGIAPLPANGAVKGASNMNAHVLCIMKDSQNKKEAAQFVEFITSKETMTNLYGCTSFFEPRVSLDKLPELNDSFLKPAKSSITLIKPIKQHPNMENAYLEIVKAAQRVTIGNESPENVVKDLDAKLKEVLK
jgi:multiple sugar transport system substrate-binding protein